MLELLYGRIRLSQGLFALVDDDQYEWLNTFTWSAQEHKSGRTYAVGRNEDGIWRSMHLLIMDMSRDYPVPRHLVVDHLDDFHLGVILLPALLLIESSGDLRRWRKGWDLNPRWV